MWSRRDLVKGMGILSLMPYIPDLQDVIYLQPLHSLPGQPLGRVKVDRKNLYRVKAILEETYDVACMAQEPIPLPDDAHYSPRNRYRSKDIIFHLKKSFGDQKVMGLTAVDISDTRTIRGVRYEDYGIMGQSMSQGTSAIISLHRLRDDWLEKVAMHEYAHLLGLPHCNNERCTLQDMEGSGKQLAKIDLGYFCKDHREMVSSHSFL